MSTMNASAETALVPAPTARTDLDPIRDAVDLAAAFLAGYKPATRAAYGRDLRHFGAFLARIGGIDAFDVRRVHVDAYLREQEEAGVAPSTIARRLSALRRWAAWPAP